MLPEDLTPLSIPSAYPRALEDVDVDLKDFMLWFRNYTYHRRGRAGVILDQLSEVVTRFVPEFGKLYIKAEPLRFVVKKMESRSAFINFPMASGGCWQSFSISPVAWQSPIRNREIL